MLISNSRKFIFVHIPKTAGTSISTFLSESLNWNDILIGSSKTGEVLQPYYRKKFGLNKHSFANEIKSVIGENIYQEYFKFAFVRHPYTRAISLYTYAKKLATPKTLKERVRSSLGRSKVRSWPIVKAYAESKDFSDFIRHSSFRETLVTAPQIDYIADSTGKIDVDFVGRFEQLNHDFPDLLKKLDIDFQDAELTKKNVSGKIKKASEIIFRESDYSHLNNLYLKDFASFSYDPDLRL